MQQFTVPQFIDVESKIIGPITTRQFLIFVVAAIIIGISYKIFDFTLFLIIAIFIAIVSVVFAFFRVNGRPFHFFVLNLVQTIRRPSLRVWNHKMQTDDLDIEEIEIKKDDNIPVKDFYQSSRLADLALVVDTQGRYRGEDASDIE